ncbi:MAG: NAD(P)H-binding protein [Myxococcota bacterium]
MSSESDAMPLVLVTGASGQTGRHIVEQLRSSGVSLRSFVRDDVKADSLGASANERFVGDLRSSSDVAAAMRGCSHLIIAAGAVPKMSLVDGARRFHFEPTQFPEDIDYRATQAQATAAQAAGVRRIVLVSSAGVTDPNHRLNQLGDSQLMTWKLKGEDAVRASGVSYAIVRPGRLLNEAPPGVAHRALRVAADDTHAGQVLRTDLAALCLAAALDDSLPSMTFNLFAEAGPRQDDLRSVLHALVP